MKAENNCEKFDQIGIDIVKGLVSFTSYTKNPDRYGLWDLSGGTQYKGNMTNGIQNKKILFEIKCNHSSQLTFDTSVLTKKDFDSLINNTPDDVTPFYIIITNYRTLVFNLRNVASCPELYDIKTKYAISTKMGENPKYRDEVWVYLDKAKCKQKGFLKIIKKGSMNYNYNIDKLLSVG